MSQPATASWKLTQARTHVRRNTDFWQIRRNVDSDHCILPKNPSDVIAQVPFQFLQSVNRVSIAHLAKSENHASGQNVTVSGPSFRSCYEVRCRPIETTHHSTCTLYLACRHCFRFSASSARFSAGERSRVEEGSCVTCGDVTFNLSSRALKQQTSSEKQPSRSSRRLARDESKSKKTSQSFTRATT